jgi:hypothetical protein
MVGSKLAGMHMEGSTGSPGRLQAHRGSEGIAGIASFSSPFSKDADAVSTLAMQIFRIPEKE